MQRLWNKIWQTKPSREETLVLFQKLKEGMAEVRGIWRWGDGQSISEGLASLGQIVEGYQSARDFFPPELWVDLLIEAVDFIIELDAPYLLRVEDVRILINGLPNLCRDNPPLHLKAETIYRYYDHYLQKIYPFSSLLLAAPSSLPSVRRRKR